MTMSYGYKVKVEVIRKLSQGHTGKVKVEVICFMSVQMASIGKMVIKQKNQTADVKA